MFVGCCGRWVSVCSGEQFGYSHLTIHTLKEKYPTLSFRLWYDVADGRFVASTKKLDGPNNRFLDRVEPMLPWMHANMHAWYVLPQLFPHPQCLYRRWCRVVWAGWVRINSGAPNTENSEQEFAHLGGDLSLFSYVLPLMLSLLPFTCCVSSAVVSCV